MADRTLEDAFQESRYFRIFMHTVYTLMMTIYAAILIGLANASEDFYGLGRAHPDAVMIVAGMIFGVIPAYVIYTLFRYHKSYALIHVVICHHAEPLHLKAEGRLGEGYKTMYGAKYGAAESLPGTGKGHWFFALTFVALVVSDAVVFISMLQGHNS